MAFRIHEHVIRGEIRNHKRNSVSGWLEAVPRDEELQRKYFHPGIVHLELTGNLAGELEGRCEVRLRHVFLRLIGLERFRLKKQTA